MNLSDKLFVWLDSKLKAAVAKKNSGLIQQLRDVQQMDRMEPLPGVTSIRFDWKDWLRDYPFVPPPSATVVNPNHMVSVLCKNSRPKKRRTGKRKSSAKVNTRSGA